MGFQAIALCIGLMIASNGITWIYSSVKADVEIRNARREEHRVCDGRITEIERAGLAEKERAVSEAAVAAAGIAATPETDAEIIVLCNQSASCRSKGLKR